MKQNNKKSQLLPFISSHERKCYKNITDNTKQTLYNQLLGYKLNQVFEKQIDFKTKQNLDYTSFEKPIKQLPNNTIFNTFYERSQFLAVDSQLQKQKQIIQEKNRKQLMQ